MSITAHRVTIWTTSDGTEHRTEAAAKARQSMIDLTRIIEAGVMTEDLHYKTTPADVAGWMCKNCDALLSALAEVKEWKDCQP